MREILFRAWQDDQDMIYQKMSGVQGALEFYKKLYYDNEYLMQFTGLQDRAGKDIYEGDILTDDTELINPNRKRIFEVFWSKDSGWLVSDNWCLSGDSLSYYAERLEIIGNIHQNKELLK